MPFAAKDAQAEAPTVTQRLTSLREQLEEIKKEVEGLAPEILKEENRRLAPANAADIPEVSMWRDLLAALDFAWAELYYVEGQHDFDPNDEDDEQDEDPAEVAARRDANEKIWLATRRPAQ